MSLGEPVRLAASLSISTGSGKLSGLSVSPNDVALSLGSDPDIHMRRRDGADGMEMAAAPVVETSPSSSRFSDTLSQPSPAHTAGSLAHTHGASQPASLVAAAAAAAQPGQQPQQPATPATPSARPPRRLSSQEGPASSVTEKSMALSSAHGSDGAGPSGLNAKRAEVAGGLVSATTRTSEETDYFPSENVSVGRHAMTVTGAEGAKKVVSFRARRVSGSSEDGESSVSRTQIDPPSKTTTSSSRSTVTTKRSEYWTKLNNLKELFDQGFITVTEYKERKDQLIDELTGTTCSESMVSKDRNERSSLRGKKQPTTVIHRPPPDFTPIKEENAIRHTFDLTNARWTETPIRVKIEPEAFARGGLRRAYHMKDLTEADDAVTYVVKISIDPLEDHDQYFQDVEMQMYCKLWADKFNECNPPKHVDFVKAWLLTLTDRQNRPLVAVERFIDGPYRKHNNNYGYVNEDERNTPQAFSHFTYEASGHTSLVCDIQGVGDLYTDPQMHTIDKIGFGKGNLGVKGFDKFLETHRCNSICRYLKLPSINAKAVDMGTIPSTVFMPQDPISNVRMQAVPPLPHYARLSVPSAAPPPTSAASPLIPRDANVRATAAGSSMFACCSIL